MHTLEQLRSGALAGIQRLTLRCGLTEFPRDIYALADSLEILDLSGNALSTLPDDLHRLHKLRIIFCSDNQFTGLPAVLGSCPALSMIGFKANRIRHVPAAALPAQLRWLVLTDNAIEELPAELGERPQLQKLMLAGNRLRALPASMAQLHKLELLRIASNQLTGLPDWLLSLPRLTWLAYAGNPFSEQRENALVHTPSAAIRWPALTLRDKLGEGASGIIYRAEWQDAGQPVAVKLFKGAMTSDGSPLSEMAACLGAGGHPNLIPILGHIEDHPDNTHGLVMSLIPPEFRNLAGPPSLDSCTRDIYAEDKRFTLQAALTIAHGIASAAAQLHAHGILHGDLYGHNILHDEHGHTLLGDFGAASFYDPAGAQADALQTLEVRAFGNLLEELLDRADSAPQPLRALQAVCQQGQPRFDTIKEQLDNQF
ncbi:MULTISPECIES: leucine-rich repeat-containing protein kinase family protein [unclassified Duganella]|uniref:leucine-rich repeat-containing protein kinase family protein n=1 Tax=unclassified Duganella TaxID=2636909 RepID=UPI00088B2701|nr:MULTISPECIES: leucine-rich repeat-containing protein kinase family protein [unclassified Duganella]SDF43899.1 Leucine Rich Repeat [Duganella sp. OV458]SDI82779.1 serine/threonine protein kinase [Duganella sp. OV510]